MHVRNTFAGPYLDRASHLREDPAWFAQALADPGSRVVPLCRGRNLFADGDPLRAAYLPLALLPEHLRNLRELILLGRSGQTHFFACEFSATEDPELLPATHFDELRSAASLLSAQDAGLLSYARALILWRRQARFCGVCGTATEPIKAGHVLMCTNPTCRHQTFPRTDSAIIVLISDGERALLGRQASWPAGRYSTIAGFVEPGESLEDAVVREVFEETGVVVDTVEYQSSQPWPFPSSLMLGFTARATTTKVALIDQELEDARWFSRADFAAGALITPPSISISFRLIEQWFNSGWHTPLRELQAVTTWTSARR